MTSLGTATGTVRLRYDGSGEMKRAVTDVSKLRGLLSATGLKGGGLLTAAGLGIGAAVIGGLALATVRAAEFEKQISAIGAVSGATGSELEAVRDKALQLGADTSFSASEAAGAMEELIKAGLTTEEVLGGAADATVSLAAASGVDLAEAATIASNAMNQFNLEAADLPGIADTIAGAANTSAIDVSDLGQSLQQVGAVANLAGLSFEDTATAIGLLGDAGIRGSDAGTSLKTMLQNLQPTTLKQIGLFEELGLVTEDGSNKFFDAQGNVQSLANLSGTLSKALSGQTKQQKLLNLETLFGTDAIRAAAVLADGGRKSVLEFQDALSKTTAAEIAKARMDNLAGSVEQFTGSLDTAAIVIGSGLLVPLRLLVDLMTKGINGLTGFATEIAERAAPGMQDLATAAGNVMEALSSLGSVAAQVGKLAVLLGVGAALLAFNLIADVIASLTGVLAEHKDIVGALVGAYALLLIANSKWLASLGTNLLFQFQYAILAMQTSMQGLTISAGAAKAALITFAAAAAPFLLIAAAGYAAIKMWTAYKDAVAETDEALKSASEAMESDSVGAMQAERDNLAALLEERKALVEEYAVDEAGDVGKFFKNAFDPRRYDDVAVLGEAADSIEEIEAAERNLAEQQAIVAEGVVDFARAIGTIDSTEAKALMEAFENGDPAALEKVDSLLEGITPALEKAGYSAEEYKAAIERAAAIKAGGFAGAIARESQESLPSLREMSNALTRIDTDAGRTKVSSDALSEAFVSIDGVAVDAEAAVNALSDALDALIGVELSAVEARIAVREGLRGLTADLAKNSRAILGNSQASDKNKLAINERITQILASIDADANAGKSAQYLALSLRRQRQDLIDTAVQLGFNRKETERYLAQMNLTPKQVKTIIEATGAVSEREKMKVLIEQYNLTPKQVRTAVNADGAPASKKEMEALIAQYKLTPTQKKTIVEATGAQSAEKYMESLLATYKLTPEQKKTIVEAAGAEASEAQMRKLLDKYNITPAQKRTIVEASGATTAESQMRNLLGQYNLTPEQKRTIIEAVNAETVKAQLADIKSYVENIPSEKKIAVVTTYSYAGRPNADPDLIPRRHGSIDYNGVTAMRNGGTAPGIYGGTRIKYAEAGPEAYIPMRKSNRRRSEWILQRVAQSFGGAFVKMAQGDILDGLRSTEPMGFTKNVRVDVNQGSSRDQRPIQINMPVYNPVSEPASDSGVKRLTSIAQMGLLERTN